MRATATVKVDKNSKTEALPEEQLLNETLERCAELVKDDKMVELRLGSNGKRLGFSGRKCIVIDGPFAETKG